MKRAPLFVYLAVFSLLVPGCAKPAHSRMEFALGTVCSVNLYQDGTDALYARIFSRIREIDRAMSVRDALDSGLVRINENAGIAPATVSADVIEVLERALHYAEISGGAFDPSVGTLVNLWGIGTDTEKVPAPQEIAEALALVNWRDVRIDARAGTVFLPRRGMALDLGAIAKGYAADEAVRIAREGKVRRAIIDLGGNIFALGGRAANMPGAAAPWRIGVQDPLEERGTYIGVLPVQDKSVVTSGVYERYFESAGRRYHHILSTEDGYPIQNGLLSVTIVAEHSLDADALSTAAFALGYTRGRALIESIDGIEAVFVFEDRGVKITNGLAGVFSLTGDRYTLAE
jgi:thiamine biosynthesis lipoprotein